VPYLEFQNDTRTIGPGVLTIGSGTEAAWRIRDHDLLPVHAIVAPASGGDALISRARSDAAVSVNGVEIKAGEHRVRFNDVIQLNSAKLTYRQVSHEGTSDVGFLRDVRRNRAYKLSHNTTIGRDAICEVLVQEPSVSRIHAEITRDRDGYHVAPKDRSYTLLNGQRLNAPTVLHEGDELSIGRTVLRFTTERQTGAITAEANKFVADARTARQPTAFMGIVAYREMQGSDRRKSRIYATIGIVVVLAVLALLFR
jgi:predicted component of type VI protein secretion system